MKVMTLMSGAWRFNMLAISCTLSRKDEKIITLVLTSCGSEAERSREKGIRCRHLRKHMGEMLWETTLISDTANSFNN